MITHYTEYRCPECGETWQLRMSQYSPETNEAIRNDFMEHLKKHHMNLEYIASINETLRMMHDEVDG